MSSIVVRQLCLLHEALEPSIQPFCFGGEHSKGLSNQADVELNMIPVNAISAADIAFIMSDKFTSYCELIECSRPIRFFVVSLMYNNTS